MSNELLTGDQIADLGLDDWRPMLGAIEARFRTGNFATGLRLINAIGEAAEAANHHPDVTLTYPAVHVLLTSHDVGGKTQRDVDLARTISQIAADMNVAAEPAAVQRLEFALDAADIARVRAFWAAALQMKAEGDDELIDPNGVIPTFWFQQTDPHSEPRQRFHLDLRIPPEEVESRLAAAVAAGGTLISDSEAPRFWVVADPEGNKICFCTHLTRLH